MGIAIKYWKTSVWGRKLVMLLLSGGMMVSLSCSRSVKQGYNLHERAVIDSILKVNPAIDTLTRWAERYASADNVQGVMLTLKELGKRYREAARFNEAINSHQRSLQLASQLADTLEMIQALNNIGTNFRRMGVLDEASTYHYKALMLCEQHSDKQSYNSKKNRVVSLNGIGNIHLTLDNREAADSVFRLALAGERELGSDLGQAINYANLGAIFEARGMTDSARAYYRYSMERNQAIKSVLGISLCHTYFGHLFEKEGKWDEALKEYRQAYDLMTNSSDRWHWLESCLALARINISKGDLQAAETYLQRAEATAETIKSWEHMSVIHHLNYQRHEKQGDCRRALDSYILSHAYADSVKNNENMNHIQNLRVNYEKEKSSRELMLIRENYEMERRSKNIFLIASLLILVLMAVAAGFLYYAVRMKSRNQQVMRHMVKVRNSFFTNITHEFRTPLTVILGLSRQLQKQKLDEKEKNDYLRTIICQGNNLLRLVNQLLDISKVKSEVEEPDWRMGNIIAYTSMIMENFRIYARQKCIELHFAPAEMDITMDFVPGYFRKIISNILSNAIKYTSKGGQVYVTVARKNNKLIIRVADTGKGMSAEELPHIFDTFYQGESHRGEMGTGIGLSLVKQMTEGMGGEITVKSAEGEGSVFTVTLPLKHGESIWKKWIPDEYTPELSLPEESQKENLINMGAEPDDDMQPAILIVEDNANVSYYIGELLKRNYRLLYARNGAEGLEKAEEFMPDMIITDMMMPEMDGYELCRRVRSSAILNHIPIIVVTAKCEEADRIRLLEAGADAYLQKPFNDEELRTRAAKLLEQRRLLREKYTHALHEGTEQSVELSPLDKEFLGRLTNIIYAQLSDSTLNSNSVADKMCMSKSQLNRKIRTITGYNTAAFILQMRMEKAKRMLASTDTPISDIAMKCGFEDASYFGRVFKQAFNITPSQHRKMPDQLLSS